MRPDGIRRVDRIVAEFDVWVDDSFPFAKFKVKVLDRGLGDLAAFANVAIRDRTTGTPDFIAGLGSTIEEATDDLFVRFVAGVRENTPPTGLTEADFAWSAPEDF